MDCLKVRLSEKLVEFSDMGKMTKTPGPAMKAFNAFVRGMDTNVAKVGFFPSAKYPDGTPIAYVAAIQEYGVPGRSLPARPFFRPTMDANENEWQRTFGILSTRVVQGLMTPKEALEAIGLKASGDVRYTIKQIQDPPLSKVTLLARKFKKQGGKLSGRIIAVLAANVAENPNIDVSGVSDKPLNDTGALLAHLTYVVEPSE